MKTALAAMIGVALLQGVAYAQQGPQIDVADGKISITASAVPLGRLLTLLDRATGMSSKVLKPELENRNITVQFTNLPMSEAVRKIFQGLPLNYVLIAGQGIRVTELAETTASPSSAPLNAGPVQIPPPNPLTPAANPAVQPAANPFFGAPANTNSPVTSPSSNSPGVVPGQLPPPPGAGNPLISPVNAPANSGGSAPATPAPAGPGTLGGATPGTIGR